MRENKKQSVFKLCLLTMPITIVIFSGNVSFAGRGSALFEEGLRIGAHFIKSSRKMHADFPRLSHTSGLSNEYRKRFTKQPTGAPIVPEAYSSDNREYYGQHIGFPLFNAAQTILFSRLDHTSGTYNEHHRRFSTQSTLAREVYSSDNRERYQYGQYAHGQRIKFPFFTAALAVLAASPQGDSDENKGQDQKKSSRVDDGTADKTNDSISSSSDSSNWREKLDKLESDLNEESISKEKKVELLIQAVTLIKEEIQFNSQDNKKVTLFLGKMGTGKSTLVGYLAGAAICWEWNDTNKQFMLKFDNMPGGIEVGSEFTSCTSVPVPYYLTSANTTMFDCPGFSDSHGLFRQIVNVKLIQDVLKRAETVNFILTVTEAALNNRVHLDELTHSIQELKSYIEDFERAKEGILLVITQGDPRPSADEWASRQIGQVLDQASLTENQRILLSFIKKKKNFVYTFRKKTNGDLAERECVSTAERGNIIQRLQSLPSIGKESLSFQTIELPAESQNRISDLSQGVNEYIEDQIKKMGNIIHSSFDNRLKKVSKDNASREEFEEFYDLSNAFNESLSAIFRSSPKEFDQFCEKLSTGIIQKSSNPSDSALSNILSEIEKTKDVLALFKEVSPKSNTYSFPQYINSIRQLQDTHAEISKNLKAVNDQIKKEDERRDTGIGVAGGALSLGALAGGGTAVAASLITTAGGVVGTALAAPMAVPVAIGVGAAVGAVAGGVWLKKEISSFFKKRYWWPYNNIGEVEKK